MLLQAPLSGAKSGLLVGRHGLLVEDAALWVAAAFLDRSLITRWGLEGERAGALLKGESFRRENFRRLRKRMGLTGWGGEYSVKLF